MTHHAADPVIGILGGMGPEATVDLMRRVIAATPARDDADHIHMIVDNNPAVPSRIAALIDKTGADPAPTLVAMARRLRAAGATVLAMPCNTAHAYAGAITGAVDVPLLNMIDLTAARIGQMVLPRRRAGLLASTAVWTVGLYRTALAPLGIDLVQPQRQADLMDIIKGVKRGETGPTARGQFARISDDLLAGGTDLLIVACSELSVIADALDPNAPVIDSLDVLGQEIVAHVLAARAMDHGARRATAAAS